MRHPGPPGYVHPCAPSPLSRTMGEVLAALWEGMCPACHGSLEPLPPLTGLRAGVCHDCCPCTLWQWAAGDASWGTMGRGRAHHLDIPEGAHC